jgi:flavin reductase (DIM6/NTAB) family NADH-FMN oxidoreductase RutF
VANLAPFSQFQNLTFDPPYVMFSANQNTEGKRKDSVVNAETTQEFVWNMATYELRDAVNQSAMEVAPEEDEFELAGLTKVAAKLVKPPRVAESPVQFECAYHMTLRLPGKGVMGSSDVVIGRVLAVHIADEALTDEGRLDIAKLRPIARLGYHDYTSVESIFEMVIPGTNEDIRRGMEGWSED